MFQINNAGDGGLYAEMVRDRSFDAIANALRINHHQVNGFLLLLRLKGLIVVLLVQRARSSFPCYLCVYSVL